MKERSTKDLIIEVLTEEWPLRPKTIYNRVKSKNDKPITYQAVFKTIKSLRTECVLDESEGGYSLGLNWIRRSKDFFDQVEKLYIDSKAGEVPYSKAHLHDRVRYEFNTTLELAIFIVKHFLDFPNPDRKPITLRWFTSYTMIGQPKSSIEKIRKVANGIDVYAIGKHNTRYDKFAAKAYKVLAKKFHIKIGVDCPDDFDYMIVGDYVGRIFFSPEIKRSINKFRWESRTISSFNLNRLLNIMYQEIKTPNIMIIEKDQEIAKQVREEIMGYFK